MPYPGQETYRAAYSSDAWNAPATAGASFLNALKQAQMAKAEQERLQAADDLAKSRMLNEDAKWADEMKLKQRQLDLMSREKAGKAAATAEMTPGRKAADMAFGKEYADWSGSGFAAAQKGLKALADAQKTLQGGAPVSGAIRGAFPDWVRAATNPEAVDVKENIRGAVMGTLRATLGAQFTEKEGERIFNLAYNDRLPPEVNLKRLERIMGELDSMAKAKQSMADYFEQKGTLTGWQGRPIVSSHIDESMFQNAAPAQTGKRYQILSVD